MRFAFPLFLAGLVSFVTASPIPTQVQVENAIVALQPADKLLLNAHGDDFSHLPEDEQAARQARRGHVIAELDKWRNQRDLSTMPEVNPDELELYNAHADKAVKAGPGGVDKMMSQLPSKLRDLVTGPINEATDVIDV